MEAPQLPAEAGAADGGGGTGDAATGQHLHMQLLDLTRLFQAPADDDAAAAEDWGALPPELLEVRVYRTCRGGCLAFRGCGGSEVKSHTVCDACSQKGRPGRPRVLAGGKDLRRRC